jgi:YggT family protein
MPAFIALLDAMLVIARPIVFGVIAVAAVLCTLDWAVRTRRISPFSGLARFTRRAVDPLITPVEHRIVRSGGTPGSAPWWALVAVAFAGLLLLALLGFLRDSIVNVYYSVSQGPAGLVRLLVDWTFTVLILAILVRVITSWVGGRYSFIGRLAHRLTDWFIEPLRRVIPTVGSVDITPLVAWFLLTLLQNVVERAF